MRHLKPEAAFLNMAVRLMADLRATGHRPRALSRLAGFATRHGLADVVVPVHLTAPAWRRAELAQAERQQRYTPPTVAYLLQRLVERPHNGDAPAGLRYLCRRLLTLDRFRDAALPHVIRACEPEPTGDDGAPVLAEAA